MAIDKTRNYAGGNYYCDINGVIIGNVKKASIGAFKADLVEEKLSVAKHSAYTVGNMTYDPMSVDFGASIGKELIEWINLSFDGEHARRDGAIVTADADGCERSRVDFFQALITEVAFPAADAAAKEGGYVTAKWAPEWKRIADGNGAKIPTGKVELRQKLFLPSSFRFEMGAMPCKLISKVDAFTWKQNVALDPIGDGRDYQQVAASVKIPTLKITGGQNEFKAWHDWFTDFCINGNCGSDKEVSGSLTYLSQNRKEELMRVDFIGCGIYSLSVSDLEANSDKINTWTAECYVERMKVVVK